MIFWYWKWQSQFYWYWTSTIRHPGLRKWLGKSHYRELGVGWRYPGSKTEPCVKVLFRSYKTRQFITGTARTLISDYMGPNHKSIYCFTTHNAILCCVPGFIGSIGVLNNHEASEFRELLKSWKLKACFRVSIYFTLTWPHLIILEWLQSLIHLREFYSQADTMSYFVSMSES